MKLKKICLYVGITILILPLCAMKPGEARKYLEENLTMPVTQWTPQLKTKLEQALASIARQPEAKKFKRRYDRALSAYDGYKKEKTSLKGKAPAKEDESEKEIEDLRKAVNEKEKKIQNLQKENQELRKELQQKEGLLVKREFKVASSLLTTIYNNLNRENAEENKKKLKNIARSIEKTHTEKARTVSGFLEEATEQIATPYYEANLKKAKGYLQKAINLLNK